MRNTTELESKAKEIQSLMKDLAELASKEDYGVRFEDDYVVFDDWLSSACYGEGDDGFKVDEDGDVWYSSGC